MEYKKSQIDGLQALIPILVGLGIILVVGFLIFSNFKDIIVDNIDADSVISESFVYSTNTSYIQLANTLNAVEFSCSAVRNASVGGGLVGTGNYTCTAGQGILLTNNTGPDDGPVWNETMYVNYSYKEADAAYNSTSTVQNTTQDIPGWLPIFVITIIGALLLGLVYLFMGRR